MLRRSSHLQVTLLAMVAACGGPPPEPRQAVLTPVAELEVPKMPMVVPAAPAPTRAAPARPGERGALPIEGIPLPPMPARSAPVPVAPGVVRESVRFESPDARLPGGRAGLWLYLPTPDRIHGPLPAVVVAAEGGDGRTGARLERAQMAHHLPWLEAGFAVLAYEIDGSVPADASDDAMRDAAERAYEASLGGLIDARNAREFLRARVPEVASGAVFAVGVHASATVAILLGAHDSGLAGVAVIAPSTPPTLGLEHMDRTVRRALEDESDAMGITLGEREALVGALSPMVQGRRLTVPTFLGLPADAPPDDAARQRQLAAELDSAGVFVTARTVPDAGVHGIGDAVAWVQAQLSARRPTR
ncbi:MAG: hypothetical protein H6733_17360 [Alphaproteobacteria bacterium]|nr:hypothetical protein [Alphaproteobacteria bacterium]